MTNSMWLRALGLDDTTVNIVVCIMIINRFTQSLKMYCSGSETKTQC